ncbi:MAG: hypothetical protein JST68_20160 [Bacteroidetes bacterium]|nr:hypothetical protein [Bacteroidota bacterium]
MPIKVDFASGFSIYDVIYNGNKIAEMRNHIIVNTDTLRYLYDNTGKPFMITFINKENVLYRHVNFTYNGNQVKEIDWDIKVGNVGFLIDRKVTFTYNSEGNVKTIIDDRPAHDGIAETISTTGFDDYDDKVNVDDFSLIHDTFHDHLFLFQGFRLQKNNPRKMSFSGGTLGYTTTYTYTYNSDGTPTQKLGQLIFTAGPQTGQKFDVSTFYTYY